MLTVVLCHTMPSDAHGNKRNLLLSIAMVAREGLKVDGCEADRYPAANLLPGVLYIHGRGARVSVEQQLCPVPFVHQDFAAI